MEPISCPHNTPLCPHIGSRTHSEHSEPCTSSGGGLLLKWRQSGPLLDLMVQIQRTNASTNMKQEYKNTKTKMKFERNGASASFIWHQLAKVKRLSTAALNKAFYYGWTRNLTFNLNIVRSISWDFCSHSFEEIDSHKSTSSLPTSPRSQVSF